VYWIRNIINEEIPYGEMSQYRTKKHIDMYTIMLLKTLKYAVKIFNHAMKIFISITTIIFKHLENIKKLIDTYIKIFNNFLTIN